MSELEAVFDKAIKANEADRAKLLAGLSDDLRSEVEELLTQDQLAHEQHLLSSLDFGLDKPLRDNKPEQIRDYQILELIGEGGMGQVFKAHHSLLKCDVAIKIMSRPNREIRDEDVARFDREIAALGGLNHPNIVQATDAGVESNINFLVMELIEGTDLRQVIKALGKLDIPDACEVIRQTATGLQHAHGHGLIHRDIKPSNLMVTTDGTVKLTDMGLARLNDWHSEVSTSGQIMGTLDYISPEQINSPHDVDQRSDLYSLGCTFYETLTGVAPFSNAKAPLQKLKGHGQELPPDLREIRPDIPAEVAEIVNRLMAKDPQDRFQSAQDLAKSLSRFAKGARIGELVSSTKGIPESLLDTDKIEDHKDSTFTEQAPTPTPVGSLKPLGKKESSSLFKLVAIGLMFAAGIALVLNTPQIIRIITNKGMLIIENSEGVEIEITRGSDDPVVVLDKANQRKYTLEVGDDYQLVVKEPETGTELGTKTFAIKRNGKTILDASVEPHSEDKTTQPQMEDLSDGQLINWMLKNGASLIKGYDKQGNFFVGFNSRPVSPEVEVRGAKLEIRVEAARSEKELRRLLNASLLLPFEIIQYYGNNPSKEILRLIAQHKSVTHVYLNGEFDFDELSKLPAGSFEQITKFKIVTVPSDKVKLLASHFTNLNSLSLDRFDFDQVEVLKQFPLTELTFSVYDPQPLPDLSDHEELETIQFRFPERGLLQPEFNCDRLPRLMCELRILNASLTDEHLEQLQSYEKLKTITVHFADTCAVTPLDMSEGIKTFKETRPDVSLDFQTYKYSGKESPSRLDNWDLLVEKLRLKHMEGSFESPEAFGRYVNVVDELSRRNPTFDSSHLVPEFKAGKLVAVEVRCISPIKDLSPISKLKDLKHLGLLSATFEGGRVDISFLRGLPNLESFKCTAQIPDLSPLGKLPLKVLYIWASGHSDLSPLSGLRLERLNCGGNPLVDLSPLEGMPLEWLCLNATPLSDLSPLSGMPLKALSLCDTKVTDLSPLDGMQLEHLAINDGTRIRDLNQVRQFPLKLFAIDEPERHRDLINSFPNLQTLNDKPFVEVRANPAWTAPVIWHMDEGAGRVIKNDAMHEESAEFTGDQTVGTGTFVGDPKWIPGVHGTALEFDGDGDGVLVGNSVSRCGKTNFTVSAWLRTTAGGVIIQQRAAPEQGLNGQFSVKVEDDGSLQFWSYDGGVPFDVRSDVSVIDGAWHHVVAQRDDHTARIYVDGQLSGTGAAGTLVLNPRLSIGIGYDLRDKNGFFKGALDDVRIYSSAVDIDGWAVPAVGGNQ